MNEKKSFSYGGYTFVPSGRLTDYGFKDGCLLTEVSKYLYGINRGCVADGHEKYNYDDFYKAAGSDCEDDVFYCPQTQELYVPCVGYLPIFDKIAKDAKEVQLRFDKRKVLCSINNGSGLNSDAMLEALFDDGQYVERQEGKSYKALGFIYGHPMLVGYALGGARMTITSEVMAPSFIESLIRERLSDEQIEAEVKHSYADAFGGCRYWSVMFYYTPAYVVENFLPKE